MVACTLQYAVCRSMQLQAFLKALEIIASTFALNCQMLCSKFSHQSTRIPGRDQLPRELRNFGDNQLMF
jgi:hypothetical protein